MVWQKIQREIQTTENNGKAKINDTRGTKRDTKFNL